MMEQLDGISTARSSCVAGGCAADQQRPVGTDRTCRPRNVRGRRQRLEEEGYHPGLPRRARPRPAGLSLVNIITVTLATHNRDNARRFARLVADLPEVQEAHALTGEMDYHPQGRDAATCKSLSDFVNDVLLPHDSVQHVKTAIVLETLKDFEGLAGAPARKSLARFLRHGLFNGVSPEDRACKPSCPNRCESSAE